MKINFSGRINLPLRLVPSKHQRFIHYDDGICFDQNRTAFDFVFLPSRMNSLFYSYFIPLLSNLIEIRTFRSEITRRTFS
jgi:hypothetical protein